MYCKKECIAMLLAGGQGSRLYDLTAQTAKPAVTFGGKYKIIDFPLSNCVNSGIDTVGVLTQYQPLELNEYIGNGAPWDLDRMRGGLVVLPPYKGNRGSDWYRGTANAIYQNLNFIKKYSPDYVLILSGDHIYKMNYAKMLEQHKKTRAACTIATVTVPLSEASRFGICNTYENGTIYQFEEKPKLPKNDQASMGIYVFTTEKLMEYLELDDNDERSDNDFGKNVIPNMLLNGENMYAYKFAGYWKDVGTLQSLWESNMDLLGENSIFDIENNKFRIFSRNSARPPQFHGKGSRTVNSLISEGCKIYGTVINSVLSGGVTVEAGAFVSDSVIMEDVLIRENARVSFSIVDAESVIGEGVRVMPQDGYNGSIVVIPKGTRVLEK